MLHSPLPFQHKTDDKIKFTDLNVDCAFLILEHLEFGDLLSVAQVNPQISMIAAAVFRRKFAHLQMVIGDEFLHPNDTSNKPYELLNKFGVKINTNTIERAFQRIGIIDKHEPSPFYVFKTHIYFQNYTAILSTFKHFGYLIKKVKLDYSDYNDLQREFVGDLISEYTSESLVEIEFKSVAPKTLEYITKPLVNIENAIFSEGFLNGGYEALPLNELFPSLRRLTLNNEEISGLEYFNHHIPNLEHISFIKGLYDETDDIYESIITKNPHILSIHLDSPSVAFLKKVHDILPQLKTLKLSNFFMRSGSIQFDNVRTFALVDMEHSMEFLHFPRLETLDIRLKYTRFAEWVQFFNEHKQIKHLYLQHWTMEDSKFEQLTVNLIDLEELKLETLRLPDWRCANSALRTYVILDFLEAHDQLRKLILISYPKDIVEALSEQLKVDWSANTFDSGISFKRKMN